MKISDGKPFLRSVPKVVEFLRNRGFKVQRTKLYYDIRKGLLRRQPDKSFSESDVLKYAAKLPRLVDAVDIEKITGQKQKAELEKIKEQTRSIVFDREIKAKKYILRTKVETLQGIKAGVFEAGLKHLLQTNMAEFFMLVGADSKKIQDGVNFWMRNVDGLLNEFARIDEIEVDLDDENGNAQSVFD
jgi:hypothetical protein